jgi:RHS repeat-associated protein
VQFTTSNTIHFSPNYHATFGMIMPGRSFTSESYRYGYQGSEKDFDVAEGDYTTHYRMLDTRLGRWFSVDPVFQPWQSSYTSMDNNPIWFNDVLGNVIDGDKKGMENYKEFREEVNGRILKINEEISKVEEGSEEFKNLMSQLNAYQQINIELDLLEADNQNLYYINSDAYKFNYTAKSDGQVYDGGLVLYNGNEIRKINIDTRSDLFFMNALAHELKHAYQYYQCRLVFIGGTKMGLNSQEFEKEAFERGNRFSGSTLLNNNFFKINYTYKGDEYKTGYYSNLLSSRDSFFPHFLKEEDRNKYFDYWKNKGYVFNIPQN